MEVSLRSRGVAESEASMLLSNECVRMYVTVKASTTQGQLHYVSKVYAISQVWNVAFCLLVLLHQVSYLKSYACKGLSDEFR